MNIGYARVSTQDQNLGLQIQALEKAGCEKIFGEKQSAVKERKELDKLISQIRAGDTVIVWKLDRLGRSLKDLVSLMDVFREKKVDFISLKDNVDTSTSHGRLFFNIMASLSEFEREIIKERTMAGLSAARSRGRLLGRPKGLCEESQAKVKAAKELYEKGKPIKEILQSLGISKTTLYRYLKY